MSKEIVSINHLNINSFDTSSGVFVGNNHAHHWRSINKTNQGFGHVSSSITKQTLNVIFDNDLVDMVTNEGNYLMETVTKKNESNQHDNFIKFNQILANTLHSNATISVGENQQNFWHSHVKNNFGNGKFSGLNYLHSMLNSVSDDDFIDIYSGNGEENTRVAREKVKTNRDDIEVNYGE